MKLTKGKLSKIRNKKNQSAKRLKKSGKGRNSKTFRKRRALNLHNSSLKKYKGGQPEEMPAKLPETENQPIVDSTNLENAEQPAPTTEQQVPTTEQPMNVTGVTADEHAAIPGEPAPMSEAIGEGEPVPASEENGEPVDVTSEVAPTSGLATEENLAVTGEPEVAGEKPLATESLTANMDDPGKGPGSDQELPPPISETGSDSAESSNEQGGESLPIAEEGPVAEDGSLAEGGPVAEGNQNASTDDVKPTNEDSTQPATAQSSSGNNATIVAESLDKLAEYLSNKIAEKLGKFGSSTELNRDSFNAVANANNSLAEA
jgi:hypothetical protein